MPACAITDHGNMFGAIEFYQSAIANGVKPIIGSEVYIAPKGRLDKTFSQGEETSNHLILLAKDEAGYKNLMKLVSIGYLEGFYYKPRIDKEVLAQYSKSSPATRKSSPSCETALTFFPFSITTPARREA